MPRVRIQFPQIVVGVREIDVDQEKYEALTEHRDDLAEFVWNNMTEMEQEHTLGEGWVNKFVYDLDGFGVFKAT